MAQVPVGAPTNWSWAAIGTSEIADGAVTSAKLASGAVTDEVIGTRTISDASAPTSDTGNLTTLLGWLANMVKQLSGKASWRTSPATTLEAASGHYGAATGVHGVGTGYVAKTSRSDQLPAWADIPDKPATFPPSAHAPTHASGGSDPLTPADIGAVTSPRVTALSALGLFTTMEVAIPLGYIPAGLASDSTGVKYETKRYFWSMYLLAQVVGAYLETDLQQLTGGTVVIDLYNYSAGASLASLTFSSTSKRSRSTVNVAPLLYNGAELGVRLNVTSAGAAGSLAGGCSPVLVVVFNVD